MSERGRDVVCTIKGAEILAANAPVMAIRASRAGVGCREFMRAYFHSAPPWIVNLNKPGTTRRSRVRHRRNAVAKQARKVNRGVYCG